MESEELKIELEKCQKKLKKANEKIAELKVEIKAQERQYEGKLKSKEKAYKKLLGDNSRLYDRESEQYYRVDSLQEELNAANKEKLKLKKRISQLEEENKSLRDKIREKKADEKWKRLELAGKEDK